MREAIETAVPLRRCTTRIGERAEIVGGPPCVPAQLGVATCPCRGHVDEDEYRVLTDLVRTALTSEPAILLRPLESRMHRLAHEERYEEAAATRDRLGALARALATPAHRRDVARRGTHRARRTDRTGRAPPRTRRAPRAMRPRSRSHRTTTDELFTGRALARQTADQLRLVRVDGCFASRLPAVVDPCA